MATDVKRFLTPKRPLDPRQSTGPVPAQPGTRRLPQVDPGILAAQKQVGNAVNQTVDAVKNYPSRVRSALDQRARRRGEPLSSGSRSWAGSAQDSMDSVHAGSSSTKLTGGNRTANAIMQAAERNRLNTTQPKSNYIQVGDGPRVGIDDQNAASKLRDSGMGRNRLAATNLIARHTARNQANYDNLAALDRYNRQVETAQANRNYQDSEQGRLDADYARMSNPDWKANTRSWNKSRYARDLQDSKKDLMNNRSDERIAVANALGRGGSQKSFSTAAPGSAILDSQGNIVSQVPSRPADNYPDDVAALLSQDGMPGAFDPGKVNSFNTYMTKSGESDPRKAATGWQQFQGFASLDPQRQHAQLNSMDSNQAKLYYSMLPEASRQALKKAMGG